MRTLFFRELHQGRALLAFSAALGLLVPVGYMALSHTPTYRFYAVAGQQDLADIFGKLILLLPLAVAIFAGAGLFAAEADRGTLPALFALPFSRRRIWGAKALGGLAVTIISAVIIVGLSAVTLPQAARAVPISAYLPDLGLALVFVFAVALFASSLTSTALAAVVSALLLGALLVIVLGFVWDGLGGRLLGYHPLLDLALWGLAAAPALCFASALVVGRCELLQSRRKHLLAFPTLVAGLLVMLLVVCGLARWMTRYDRDRVESIRPASMLSGSAVVAFTTEASAVPFQRDRPGEGWRLRPTSQESNEVGSSEHGPLYRSTHHVFLDLRSGRERLVLRGPATDAYALTSSPDGRYAAALTGPGSITWGRESLPGSSSQTLRIYDLKRKRQAFAGRSQGAGDIADLLTGVQWSPSGRWLGLSAITLSGKGHHAHSVYAIRRDGSGLRDLHVNTAEPMAMRAWVWSPTEEAIYMYDEEGRVGRVPIEGGTPRFIWSLNQPRDHLYVLALEPSPDGKWLALCLSGEIVEKKPTRVTTVHAIATDSGAARTILTLTPPAEQRARFSHTRLAWAADSSALFLLAAVPESAPRLLRWRPGEETAMQLGAPLAQGGSLAVAPGSSLALVYPWRQDEAPFLVDAEGTRQPVLSADFARTHDFIGFDGRGRVVTQGRRDGRPAVEATDLKSGQSEQIYP